MHSSSKGGKNYTRLLLPVIALLLSVAAMGGLAYSALNSSTVTNTSNIIGFEGIDAMLLNDEGDLITGAEFSSDAGLRYKNLPEGGYELAGNSADMKIGGATLFMKYNGDKYTSVNIAYEVEFSIPGIEVELELREKGDAAGNFFDTAPLIKNEEYYYEIELFATFENGQVLSTSPEGLTYTIRIIITPAL